MRYNIPITQEFRNTGLFETTDQGKIYYFLNRKEFLYDLDTEKVVKYPLGIDDLMIKIELMFKCYCL